MNLVRHEHDCYECAKEYKCDKPECQSLTGTQGICPWCSYYYGWRQANNPTLAADFYGY